MSRKKKTQEERANGECVFCKTSRDDEESEVTLGKLMKGNHHDKTVFCHYNCLFLASGLSQNGIINQDGTHQGIFGFLIQDILKEANRAARLKCSFCRKPGASIGCCYEKCKTKFHLHCGLEQYSIHYFFGHFESFCVNHRQPQRKIQLKNDDNECPLCLYEKSKHGDVRYMVVHTPCCQRWMHKNCIQRHALNAGLHHFQCPLCKNKSEKFLNHIRKAGINIPDRDASWETGDSFADLYQRQTRCDAPECRCPEGRDFTGALNGVKWKIIRCVFCGSQGTHSKCQTVTKPKEWACDVCSLKQEPQYIEPSTSSPSFRIELDSDTGNTDIEMEEINETIIERSNIGPDIEILEETITKIKSPKSNSSHLFKYRVKKRAPILIEIDDSDSDIECLN